MYGSKFLSYQSYSKFAIIKCWAEPSFVCSDLMYVMNYCAIIWHLFVSHNDLICFCLSLAMYSWFFAKGGSWHWVFGTVSFWYITLGPRVHSSCIGMDISQSSMAFRGPCTFMGTCHCAVVPCCHCCHADNFWTGLKCPKVRNWPQEGPEDREEAWGQLGAQTWRKWATWASRRESCLSFSVLSSTCKRRASQGQGSLQQYKSAKSNNQL